MGDQAMQKFEEELCAEVKTELSSVSTSDMILINRNLRSIYVICKDYLSIDGPTQEVREQTQERVTKQYKFFRCNVMRKVNANNAKSKMIGAVFGIVVTILLWSLFIYLLWQIYKFVSGKKVQVNFVSALTTIVVINPVASVITVTMEGLSFQTSNRVSQEVYKQIMELRDILRISCVANFDKNAKDFVDKYERSELFEDMPAKRMNKISEINQFVDNLRNFVYRSENSQLSAATEETILRCYVFLKGGDMDMLDGVLSTESSSQTEEDDRMYFKSSKTVRARAGEILRYFDSGFDASNITSYNDYFLEALNSSIRSLTLFAIKHAKSTDVGFGVQLPTKFCSDATTEALAGADHSVEIGTHFGVVCDRVRKMKRLMLPEYEYLLKFLNPSENPEWTAFVENFDESITTSEDVLTIVELWLNNTEYLYRNLDDQSCQLGTHEVTRKVNEGLLNEKSYSIMIPKLICTPAGSGGSGSGSGSGGSGGSSIGAIGSSKLRGSGGKCLTYKEEFDIKAVYVELGGATWRDNDTLLYARTKTFLKTLDKSALPQNYRTKYKLEIDLVDDVLEKELQFDWTVESVMGVIEARDSEDASSSGVVVQNVEKMFRRLYNAVNDPAVKKLVFDRDKTIENPNLFISFEQFDEKLSNMSVDKYGKFDTMVKKNMDNVKFFNERIEEINDSAEVQVHMSGVYQKYIVCYCVLSLITTCSYCYQYYSGKSVDQGVIDMKETIKMKKKRWQLKRKNNAKASKP